MDCSPPGSCGHELSQARILEWGATPSSRGASQPRDRTHVSCSFCTADGLFTAGCHGSSAGKESACNVGVLVWSLGWKDPLERGNATHSSILAWRIPWTIVYEVPKSRPWLRDFHFYFLYCWATGEARSSYPAIKKHRVLLTLLLWSSSSSWNGNTSWSYKQPTSTGEWPAVLIRKHQSYLSLHNTPNLVWVNTSLNGFKEWSIAGAWLALV